MTNEDQTGPLPAYQITQLVCFAIFAIHLLLSHGVQDGLVGQDGGGRARHVVGSVTDEPKAKARRG